MNSLRTPSVVAHLELAIFDNIAAISAQDDGIDWYPEATIDSPLHQALRPVTELILNDMRRTPDRISYSISSSSVEPDESQRGMWWHVDGNTSYTEKCIRTYVASDTLPTEFLIREPGMNGLLHAIGQRRAQHRVHKWFWHENEVHAENLGMEIHIPEPFALVAMKNHIHRSPVNQSDAPIKRTWLRARVVMATAKLR